MLFVRQHFLVSSAKAILVLHILSNRSTVDALKCIGNADGLYIGLDDVKIACCFVIQVTEDTVSISLLVIVLASTVIYRTPDTNGLSQWFAWITGFWVNLRWLVTLLFSSLIFAILSVVIEQAITLHIFQGTSHQVFCNLQSSLSHNA